MSKNKNKFTNDLPDMEGVKFNVSEEENERMRKQLLKGSGEGLPPEPETDSAVERIIGEKIPDSIHCRATGGRCVPVYEITELDGSKRLACKHCAGVGKDRKAIRSL